MGDGISGVGRLSYTFARQNDPVDKTAVGAELRGVKNTHAQPRRLNIQQALSSDKILAKVLEAVKAPNALQSGNYSLKVINNNEGEATNTTFQRSDSVNNEGEANNTTFQRSDSVNTEAASETLTGGAFKQALCRALKELPSGKSFLIKKHNDAHQDLRSDCQNKKGECWPTVDGKKIPDKTVNQFLSVLDGSAREGRKCINDFLIIRKEIKNELSPDDREGLRELNALTGKMISKIAKHGLGIDSYAAGATKAGYKGLVAFEEICNGIVKLAGDIKKESGLTFNPEISMKIATALSGSGLSEAQCKEILTNNQNLFRNAIAEHTDMHSSMPDLSLSSFKIAQTMLHHEASAFDLLNNSLSEILDNVPAADAGKNNGPVAGPAAQPAQITYNITIDNSIHSNINDGMNAGQPVNTDSGNTNLEETSFTHRLSQTENAPYNSTRHAQTEAVNQSEFGVQASDSADAAVIEEPFTRQSAKVNNATIPSLPPEETGADEVSPAGDQQEPQPTIRSATAPFVNTAGKASQTAPQEEPVIPSSLPSTAHPDTQPVKTNADKGTTVNSEQPADIKSETRSIAPQTTIAAKPTTVDASTSYFGSPGSSGARSTPSDATRSIASGKAGVGAGTQTRADGGLAQPLTVSTAAQTRALNTGKATFAGSEQVMGVKPGASTVGQQTAKVVEHPTVDASTSYFGSPGSSGARSTPSDATRSIASGKAGVGAGTQTRADGGLAQPLTVSTAAQTRALNTGTGKATFAGSEQVMGVKPGASTVGQQTAKVVEHPTVDASTSYFGSPGSSGARSTPSDATRNIASGRAGVGAGTQTRVDGELAQPLTVSTAAQTQALNTGKATFAGSEQVMGVKPGASTVGQQTAKVVEHPTVDASTSYFGSPGSSGARSTPSDAVRNKANTGTEAGRGMQAPAEVRSRIGEHAVLQPSPVRHYARVQPAVENAPAIAITRDAEWIERVSRTSSTRAAVTQQMNRHTVTSNQSSDVVRGNGSVGRGMQTVRAEPARVEAYTQTDTQARQPAAEQPVSDRSGLRVGVQNRRGQQARLGTSPLINSAQVHTTVQKAPADAMVANTTHENSRADNNTQSAVGVKHPPAKQHPKVNINQGYLGSPGSSGARSVPSEFATGRNKTATRPLSPAIPDKNAVAPQVPEQRQPVGSQNSGMAENQPRGEARKNAAVQPSINRAVKEYPGTTNGYVGGPGSSAARAVPSDFARRRPLAGAITAGVASEKVSVERNKLAGTNPQHTAATSYSNARKLTTDSVKAGAKVEKTARDKWEATYMDKENQGYIGSRGSAQSTPLFNNPANKK